MAVRYTGQLLKVSRRDRLNSAFKQVQRPPLQLLVFLIKSYTVYGVSYFAFLLFILAHSIV